MSYKPGQKKSTSTPARSSFAVANGTSAASAARLRLQRQIAELSTPTPKDFDPEDTETGGLTAPSFASNYDNDDAADDEYNAPKLYSERNTLRKNFDVEDVSAEYKGKVVSRKSLNAFSDDEELDDGEEEDEDAAEDGEDDDDEVDEDDDAEIADDADEDDEGEVDDQEDDEEHDEGEDDEDGDADGLSEQQRRVQQQLAALEEEDEQAASLFQPRGAAAAATTAINDSGASSQYTKSIHMKNQLAWYTHLLNLRIRMQAALTHANRLPSTHERTDTESGSSEIVDVRSKFVEHSPEVSSQYKAAFDTSAKLLEELFELQSGLMAQNEPLFGAGKAHDGEEDEDAAESISSIPQFDRTQLKRKREADVDGDEEQAAADDDADLDSEATEEDLSTYWRYMSGTVTPFFRPIQDALIQKWNTKTQLSAGQLQSAATTSLGGRGGGPSTDASFKVINQSVLAQIDSIMLDEARLVKRAQLYRSAAATPASANGNTDLHTALLGRVGRSLEQERRAKKAKHSNAGATSADAALLDDESHLLQGAYAEEYDSAIYDDNDYYQQLLAEIISAASSDAAGGDADLLNTAAAARKKTRKGGAAVDRRASKGRKLRYTVHPKLANFMAPKPAPITSEYLAQKSTTGGSDANLLTGSGFAMDELFMNLFGGAGSK